MTGRHERTWWGFTISVVVLILLGASLSVHWWTYKYSSGPRAPPGGPQPENMTLTQRERLDVYPYRTEGHSNNTTAPHVQEVTRVLGHLVVTSLVVAGLIALFEIPLPIPISTRWITLPLVPIGFFANLSALIWAWLQIPPLLETAGVEGIFTTRPVPDGFIQSWLWFGWLLAGIASLGFPAIAAFKYQAGATDPTVIESFQQKQSRV